MMISRAQIGKIVEIYRAQGAGDAQKSPANKEQASDNVSVPFKQEDIDRVKQIVKKLPDIREDRVKDCAAKISDGKYTIDSKEVADKMLGRLFADRIK